MTGPLFLGVNGIDALFNVDGSGVLLNTRTNSTRTCDLAKVTSSRYWMAAAPTDPRDTWSEIASYAVSKNRADEIEVITASNTTRALTVPKAVRKEAELGLARAARLGRQTPMTLFTGRLLASADQITYSKLQHIARFLNADALSEVDNRNVFEKTTWSLWGGDPARRWVNSMIGKRTLSLTADGFIISQEDIGKFDREDIILFALTQEGDPFAVEGLFYVNDGDDTVYVWDAGHWVAYGDTDQLDEWADRLVEVDEETAMNIAASFDEIPGNLVHLSALNAHETALAMMAGFDSTDPDLPLLARVAAAEYTPEERAANAGSQPRDANGRFATVGAEGSMKSGTRATIRGVNPTNNYLLVEAQDGSVYSIPSRDFTVGAGPQPDPPIPPQPPQPGAVPGAPVPGQPGAAPQPPKLPPLDLSKILAQPRALPHSSKAVLDHTLPTLDAAQLRKIVENYNKFIRDERNKNASKFSAIENNPLATNPDTSDVKPIYMAEVDRDDTKAVLDLIALSPAATNGAEATTFRRVGGQWVRDDSVLQDLKSPTPPPIVVLNETDYQSVLMQVDKATANITAAGRQFFIGANNDVWEFLTAAGDNQSGVGSAERLRIYWSTGKGGIKIRWGTDGDWTRCHRYLRKYLGERSAGYCANIHHRMTGMWPGDRRNRD